MSLRAKGWDPPQTKLPICAAGAATRTVVYGRRISSTKVKALPESLGTCKLLKILCVRVAVPLRCLLATPASTPGRATGRCAAVRLVGRVVPSRVFKRGEAAVGPGGRAQ